MAHDRKKLLERIKNLTSKTVENGCTEAEAISAAEMVARLMDQYGFSGMDLQEEDQENIVENRFFAPGKNLKEYSWIAGTIASFCDCKIWLQHAHRSSNTNSSIVYFGRESDSTTAVYLTHLLFRAMESAWREYQTTEAYLTRMVDGRVIRTSFMAGMANRLRERLAAMKAARNTTVDPETHKTGQDLVIVKNAEVETAYQALSLKLTKGQKNKTQVKDNTAWDSGREAANSVSIAMGVNGKSETLQIA